MVTPPPEFDEEQAEKWRRALLDQVVSSIRPGFEHYRDVIRDEVLPAARPQERSGVKWLPGRRGDLREGRTSPYVTRLGRRRGTPDRTRRDRAESRTNTGSWVLPSWAPATSRRSTPGSVTTPSFASRTATRSARRHEWRWTAPRDEIPDWFGRLPLTDCVMADVPEPGAQDAPLAYYLPPAADGSRPGTFFINTTQPDHTHAVRERGAGLSRVHPRATTSRSPSPRNWRTSRTFASTPW